MDSKNVTMINMIYLLGFQTPKTISYLLFIFFLAISFVTLFGNLLIITLVAYSKTLHTPMYFFLTQLSLSDILLTSDILPMMLHTILVKQTKIPLADCITQFYFFSFSECTECLLLTSMSYDRYLAICKPLHYTMLMTPRICWILVVLSWSLSILIVLTHTVTISQLPFCGPDVIDHLFCDLDPILELSCADTTPVQLELLSLGSVFFLPPFIFIIVSYVYIIATIFKIPSTTGRNKTFSTCSSHLSIVSIYFCILLCIYWVPSRGQSGVIYKCLSLLYTVLTPLMNPVVYSLRNKDLKKSLMDLFNKIVLFAHEM
ncbi:olfactory receptor 1468-like [Gastrophryne carolinensis]